MLLGDPKKQPESTPQAYRRTYITNLNNTLNSKTHSLVTQCYAWYIICESKLQSSFRYEISSGSTNPNLGSILDMYCNILLKGLSLSYRITNLVNTILILQTSMSIPLTKSNLNDIILLLEQLKAIEFTFKRKELIIIETITHIIRQYHDFLFSIIKPLKIKLFSRNNNHNNNNSGEVNDLSFILYVLEHLIQTTETYTTLRLSLLIILSDIIISCQYITEKESAKLKLLIKRIISISRLYNDLFQNTSTTFVYFHLELFSSIITNLYDTTNSIESYRLIYIIACYNDIIKLIIKSKHLLISYELFHEKYQKYIENIIVTDLILPLAKNIETDLRLHIHSKHLNHMNMSDINPKINTNLKTYLSYLKLNSINILGLIININNEIIHYLNKNFYNLTTIALHDWRMYAEMRSLAMERYNILLLNNFLPMGSLDQGLDVLQIMRNIHIFVSRFTYNMNIQQFVEYRPTVGNGKTNTTANNNEKGNNSSSKHLNTIQIQSIAASIRQHGLGEFNFR